MLLAQVHDFEVIGEAVDGFQLLAWRKPFNQISCCWIPKCLGLEASRRSHRFVRNLPGHMWG